MWVEVRFSYHQCLAITVVAMTFALRIIEWQPNIIKEGCVHARTYCCACCRFDLPDMQ